jgi:hypothetical protein
MSAPKKAAPPVSSASEYILDNFKPTDRIAVLVLNRQLGETTQRITTAQKASSPEFQAWLRYKNANGADIYVGMNALQQHASTRAKDDIEKISHVYLDLDHGGTASLEALENSDLVPSPNYVLDTSPGKFQVVWKVDGMSMEEAEALNQAMVREFDGDPAATDSTRVLRIPGFANKKYEADFYVQARAESTQTYPPPRFQAADRLAGRSAASARRSSPQTIDPEQHLEPIRARLGLRKACLGAG